MSNFKSLSAKIVERNETTKEKEKNQAEIMRLEKKLSNEGFLSKAPAAVVAGERDKLEKYKELLVGIEQALEKLM